MTPHSTAQDTDWNTLLGTWEQLVDVRDLEELLIWDQGTQLPAAAGAGRGRQAAYLATRRQATLNDPAYAQLLHDESRHKNRTPEQQRALELARREHDRAARLPDALVRRSAELGAEGYAAWLSAKTNNDFQRARPVLERLVDLRVETASYFPEFANPLDFYIDQADEGCTSQHLDALFGSVRPALVQLLRAQDHTTQAAPDLLAQPFDLDRQRAFARQVMTDLGFEMSRGVQSAAPHPFMVRTGNRDIRIATRFDPQHLGPGLFSTLHETGHALYEQGIDESYLSTPLGVGVSAGVHESQARLWENLVGRTLPFWEAYLPELQRLFPEQLGAVSAAQLHQAVNRVTPGPLRTQADELTYNLHIIIRYDLERALLSGGLAVKDLPDAWNAAYEDLLGLTPPSDQQGVLQDVHWYAGQLGGAFHSYTLGNVLATQFFTAAQAALPGLDEDLRNRSFAGLRGWLTQRVYQQGRRWSPATLTKQVTSEALDASALIRHLAQRFSGA